MSTNENLEQKNPSVLNWALKIASSAGLVGILCCVAPAVLFMFGLMGGAYAISFADFFYNSDGSVGTSGWILRIVAIAIGAFGVYRFSVKQSQCSTDPKRKKKNLVLVTAVILLLGLGLFLSLEKWSAWYFDTYVVPAQQDELKKLNS